ncbi:hypothetical protein KIH87_02510 [Paraneptunicella aestuarii]|uniref:hypothetical protein n=1 Tax=Paraneptunicella aestuarii TaxID=2831148 RepID=UPI001E40B39B|nr:hypothetical protein [Paraneptunicella aestuarii]UAA39256.1 hypothetical protein KIH87_02510 [Paraneptunicella aestuarii]
MNHAESLHSRISKRISKIKTEEDMLAVIAENHQDIADTFQLTQSEAEDMKSVPFGLDTGLLQEAEAASDQKQIVRAFENIQNAMTAASASNKAMQGPIHRMLVNDSPFDQADLIYATFVANQATSQSNKDVEVFMADINRTEGPKSEMMKESREKSSFADNMMNAIYAGIDAATPKLIVVASTAASAAMSAVVDMFKQTCEVAVINKSSKTLVLSLKDKGQYDVHGKAISTANRLSKAVKTRHGYLPITTILTASSRKAAAFGPQIAFSFHVEDNEDERLTIAIQAPVSGNNVISVTDKSAKYSAENVEKDGNSKLECSYEFGSFKVVSKVSSSSGTTPKMLVIISDKDS